MRPLALIVFGLLPTLAWAPGEARAADEAAFRFTDRARDASLTAPTWCGREEKPHILESGGTGLALLDYDADGDLDLYLVNGWRLEGTEVVERGRNLLYRNRGDGTFDDVTQAAGVGDPGWGTGVGVGDLDLDGDLDLFVSNFGPDVLYLNQGDGTFEAAPAGPSIDGWSTGAAFFDADGDADLDLYLGAYIDCTLEEVIQAKPELLWEGMKVMLGPFGLEGKANRYFENLGDGRFTDRTEAAGLEDRGLFYSFGIIAADLDGDDHLDLYVANDSNPNYLYRNDGKGIFEEVGLWSGAAVDAMGNSQAGMGLAAGDLDNDGRLDLFVTNFYQDFSTLYRNLGDFLFEDATRAAGLIEATFMPLSWGTTLRDFDLDGDLDLFIANGHIYPQADRVVDGETAFRQPNMLLENREGRFIDRSAGAGPGLAVIESSRGLASGDVDGDGDVDLVVSNMDAPPSLLVNETDRRGGWLLIDAPGALRATVEIGDLRLVRHGIIGSSYVSASDPRLHFGLGPAERVDRLTLVAPGGARRVVRNLPAGRAFVFPPG